MVDRLVPSMNVCILPMTSDTRLCITTRLLQPLLGMPQAVHELRTLHEISDSKARICLMSAATTLRVSVCEPHFLQKVEGLVETSHD